MPDHCLPTRGIGLSGRAGLLATWGLGLALLAGIFIPTLRRRRR